MYFTQKSNLEEKILAFGVGMGSGSAERRGEPIRGREGDMGELYGRGDQRGRARRRRGAAPLRVRGEESGVGDARKSEWTGQFVGNSPRVFLQNPSIIYIYSCKSVIKRDLMMENSPFFIIF